MSGKTPVQFLNRNHKRLFGMIHAADPEAVKQERVIVLLSPGIKSRVAPHRLYVKMSEAFARMGYTVFRFDPEGIGDSEGEIHEDLMADVLGGVEFGRFVDSTLDALDWLGREMGATRFIVGGLCGGAITGLLAAAKDERITALIGLGIPCTSSAITNKDPYRFMSRGQLEGYKQGYFKNLLSLKRWWRFVTLQSDYKMIWTALTSSSKKKDHGTASEPAAEVSDLNPLFPEALFSVLESGRRMCLVFSEADRLYWDFDEKFLRPHHDRFARHADLCEVQVIAEANHIFSFPEWEQAMMQKVEAWLSRCG